MAKVLVTVCNLAEPILRGWLEVGGAVAYYPDLAPCTYFTMASFPPLIAVGWLDAAHPFPVGDPESDIVERLQILGQMKWMPIYFMGAHVCEFCGNDPFRGPFFGPKDFFIPGEEFTYAAPQGIVHYIDSHGYLPPQEFCDAVRRCPAPDTPEFFAALRRNGWSEQIARPASPSPEQLEIPAFDWLDDPSRGPRRHS